MIISAQAYQAAHLLSRAPIMTSVLLIRPEELTLMVEKGSKGLNRVRAKFAFKGETYCLIVTAPSIEAVYLPKDIRHYAADRGPVYMTVSISEPLEGFCHKLAPALFFQSNERLTVQ
jgi:hypothetical protein